MDYRPLSKLSLGGCATVHQPLIFGTALIEDVSIITHAIASGFRAFDTAAQPHNYHEEALGEALRQASDQALASALHRDDVFIQTKFTTPRGQRQDTCPYSMDGSIADMVDKSLRSSLSKLQVDYVDVLLLHGPMPTLPETIEALRCMQTHVPSRTRHIGISNVTPDLLQSVLDHADIRVSVVQNPFDEFHGFDGETRALCAQHGILYQAFGVVRRNRKLLESQLVGWLAEKTSVSEQEALVALFLSLNTNDPPNTILVGSQNKERISQSIKACQKLGIVPDFIRQGFEKLLHLSVEQGKKISENGRGQMKIS